MMHATGGAGRGQPLIALMLALIVGASAVALAYSLNDRAGPLVMIGLGIFSFAGLIALFGWLAGFVTWRLGAKMPDFADQVVDSFDEALVVTGPNGDVLYANGPYRALAQTGEGPIPVVETLYSGHPEIAEQLYRLVQASHDGRPLNESLAFAPGSSAPGALPDRRAIFEVSVVPLPAGAGHSLWRLKDVTQDQAKQADAFEQLQQIIDYLDHAPAGFFSADANGRVNYVNATLAEWLNLDFASTTGGVIGLEDLLSNEALELFASIHSSSEPSRTETLEVDLKTADGSALPVEMRHRVVIDQDGRFAGSQSLVLGPAAAAGVPSAAGGSVSLGHFFKNAPIGIALLDAEGVIVSANAALRQLAGGAARRGQPLAGLFGEGEDEAFVASLADALAGDGNSAPADVTFPKKDNNRGQIILSRLEENGDEGASVVAYVVDRTEQHSLEQQFVQGQKMQAVGQLAGGVAHDFNNVLTAIIGNCDLLLTRLIPTDPSFQDIFSIKQNANRAANLVRQLLAFSRQQTLRPEVLQMTTVLSDLGNLLGRLVGARIELKTVHQRDLWSVKADLIQFEQVVVNLAVNARDAMPGGGTLTINTSNVSLEESHIQGRDIMPAGEYVRCDVSDTGTGMAPAVMAKMFEPFFTTKEVGKGTGLGLSTVFGIVKQTGGFIFCDSVEGRGTTFSIYLPRHIPDANAEEVVEREEVKETPSDLTGTGTILLVEDEDGVRQFSSRALTARGYTVIEATTGVEALQQIEQYNGQIDLMVSDVVMPAMDGLELLEEMRNRDIQTRVIFMSGYAEDKFRSTLEANEDIAFLRKPFELKQLVAAVKKAMPE